LVGSEFELKQLLRSQVLIAKSFQHAMLTFRHDSKTSRIFRQLFNESRSVQGLAIKAVQKYANTAAQVCLVLPDMMEAVRVGFAAEALDMVGDIKSWLTDLQQRGKEVQCSYGVLIEKMQKCADEAAQLKNLADHHISEQVQAMQAESKNGGLIQDGQVESTLSRACGPRAGSKTDITKVLAPKVASFGPKLDTVEAVRGGGYLNTLFRKLENYCDEDRSPVVGFSTEDFEELIEVAFLCPGFLSGKRKQTSAETDSTIGETEQQAPAPSTPEKAAASYLVSTLHELRRIEQILQKSLTFWEFVDETVGHLEMYKEHTRRMLEMSTKSARMLTRFEERVEDYTHFWRSLGDLCSEYASKAQVGNRL
jgi:hypothetical protein